MLTLDSIGIAFGDNQVLDKLSLTVEQGEIMCLLGPSGCGKTTLLRIVAGLEKPEAGTVRVDDRSLLDVPVHQRGFGLMFQDFALFPHMNVAENIGFGLRMQGVAAQERAARVHEVLALVGLEGFEHRDVAQLSGGERQRVALARSLAPNPRLLMLDEPLGSIDAALRERLILDLRAIIKQVGLTAIYVTHDQAEAFAVADRVAVMNAGRIEQIDTPQALYRKPRTEFVARFLGLTNILPVQSRNGTKVHTALGSFELTYAGEARAVLLHPAGIMLDPAADETCCSGTVESCVFLGQAYRLMIACDADIRLRFEVRTETPPDTGARISFGVGRVLPLT